MKKPKNDWRGIVAAYKNSGRRQTEWCRENNVNLNNLRFRLQKEKNFNPGAGKACQWLALDIAPQPAAGAQRLIIRIGQAGLEISPGFDLEYLADVVKVLRAACFEPTC